MNQKQSWTLFVARARVYISAGAICFAAATASAAPDNDVILATATVALSAASPKDRADAALVLAREQATDKLPELEKRLSAETDWNVRQALAIAFSNLGEGAFNGLKTLLADPIAEVRLEAANGLGRLGTQEAAAALRERLPQETNEGVKADLIFWLGQLKDDASSDEIDKSLRGGDANLREQAAHSLRNIDSAKAKSHLRRAGR